MKINVTQQLEVNECILRDVSINNNSYTISLEDKNCKHPNDFRIQFNGNEFGFIISNNGKITFERTRYSEVNVSENCFKTDYINETLYWDEQKSIPFWGENGTLSEDKKFSVDLGKYNG